MASNTLIQEIAESKFNQELVPWFLENFRKMTDEPARDRLARELIKNQAFYVPFDEYFSKCFGARAVGAFSDYYSKGKCVLTGSMIFPLSSIRDDFIGLLINNPRAQDKYNYPVKYTFDKSRHMQVTTEDLTKAFEEKYICIVEGVYDKFAVTSLDLPCVGLNGSELGKVRRMILDVYPTKIIISDKDDAGRKLFKECERNFSGKVINVNVPTRDIDAFLRVEKDAQRFKRIIEEHQNNGFPYNIIEVPA